MLYYRSYTHLDRSINQSINQSNQPYKINFYIETLFAHLLSGLIKISDQSCQGGNYVLAVYTLYKTSRRQIAWHEIWMNFLSKYVLYCLILI